MIVRLTLSPTVAISCLSVLRILTITGVVKPTSTKSFEIEMDGGLLDAVRGECAGLGIGFEVVEVDLVQKGRLQ